MANPFYFGDGSSVSTSQELEAALENESLPEFQEHIAQGHFASWIRHELGNEKLADRVEQCRSVQQVLDVLHLEHTPKPKPAEKPKEPEPKREPIRDLGRPAVTMDDVPTQPESKPAPVTPKIPEPIKKKGFLERYNAKEFVIGLVIGIVLGVLIYALFGALA